jgi:hypothetical protein
MTHPKQKKFKKDLTQKIKKETGAYVPAAETVVVNRPSPEEIERASKLQQKDSAAGQPASNSHAGSKRG